MYVCMYHSRIPLYRGNGERIHRFMIIIKKILSKDRLFFLSFNHLQLTSQLRGVDQTGILDKHISEKLM